MLSPVENPAVFYSADSVPINELLTSQIQAYQALADLSENLPSIPEACRRCRHGGDLHYQRLKNFRLLASGLMLGLSAMIHRVLSAFGGKVVLIDGVVAESRTDRQSTSSGS